MASQKPLEIDARRARMLRGKTLDSRSEHALAVETGDQLLTSPTIEMVDVQRPLVDRAWQYFVRHDDKRYSPTDCISFIVMAERSISEALAFDTHFSQAGFQTTQ